MKFLVLFIICSLFFFGCNKPSDHPAGPNLPANNPGFKPVSFSGAIDSIITWYSGTPSIDSGVYAGVRLEKFEFAYDNQHRVARLTRSGDVYPPGISQYSYFYYHGSDEKPIKVKDSIHNVPNPYSAEITEIGYHYDDLGRKDMDTIVIYKLDLSGKIDSTTLIPDIVKRYFGPGYFTSTSTNNSWKDHLDTIFFDGDGNYIRQREYDAGRFDFRATDFYAVENPFQKLNISSVVAGQHEYGWNIMWPIYFYVQQPRNLVKHITGYDNFNFRHNFDDTDDVYLYYQKDNLGRVDGIVISSYINDKFNRLGNIKFYYHP